MSPKAKSSLLNLSAVIGAVVAVAGITAPVARAIAKQTIITHGESTFVRRDTFFVFQQSLTSDRRVDSVVRAYEIRDFNALRADVDTIKQMLRRR